MIREYVQSLTSSDRLGKCVVYHKELIAKAAKMSWPRHPLPEVLLKILKASGIKELYSHQAEALDAIRSGNHTTV